MTLLLWILSWLCCGVLGAVVCWVFSPPELWPWDEETAKAIVVSAACGPVALAFGIYVFVSECFFVHRPDP